MMLRQVLSAYRKSCRISLAVLSKQIGIPLMTLHRFERGNTVQAKVICKILRYLL